jgi:hypothetical protein
LDHIAHTPWGLKTPLIAGTVGHAGTSGQMAEVVGKEVTGRSRSRWWPVDAEASVRSVFDGPLDEGPGVALRINDPNEANTPRFVERWSYIDIHLGQAAVARVRVINPDTSPTDAARRHLEALRRTRGLSLLASRLDPRAVGLAFPRSVVLRV